jgi:Protein of unknown function (DUF3800)
MSTSIYLDESGDLGWRLDQPYKRGGSSRYLSLAAVIVPSGKSHLIARIVRGLYKARGRSKNNELKSVDLQPHERTSFIRDLIELRKKHPDILFQAITVNKYGVNAAFRKHPNGLYNYMTKLMLVHTIGAYSNVDFIPDARSIKVELTHSLHDYLRTELAAAGYDTELTTTPQESKAHFEIQFADILASIVWSHFEFGTGHYPLLADHISHLELFFQ